MATLPNTFSIQMGIGSLWSQNYVLQNSDGSLANLTGKIFEFVVRTDPSQASSVTPAIIVTTTSSSAGVITVNTATATVNVLLNPSATAALSQTSYHYTLWMDQGLSDATAWVTGTIFASQIALP